MLAVAPSASVTVTFTLAPLAGTVGVPPIVAVGVLVAVVGLMFIPVGRLVAVQVYGAVPPVTETTCEYAEFSVPAGRVAGVILLNAELTTKV
jgi:hypothetical protein